MAGVRYNKKAAVASLPDVIPTGQDTAPSILGGASDQQLLWRHEDGGITPIIQQANRDKHLNTPGLSNPELNQHSSKNNNNNNNINDPTATTAASANNNNNDNNNNNNNNNNFCISSKEQEKEDENANCYDLTENDRLLIISDTTSSNDVTLCGDKECAEKGVLVQNNVDSFTITNASNTKLFHNPSHERRKQYFDQCNFSESNSVDPPAKEKRLEKANVLVSNVHKTSPNNHPKNITLSNTTSYNIMLNPSGQNYEASSVLADGNNHTKDISRRHNLMGFDENQNLSAQRMTHEHLRHSQTENMTGISNNNYQRLIDSATMAGIAPETTIYNSTQSNVLLSNDMTPTNTIYHAKEENAQLAGDYRHNSELNELKSDLTDCTVSFKECNTNIDPNQIQIDTERKTRTTKKIHALFQTQKKLLELDAIPPFSNVTERSFSDSGEFHSHREPSPKSSSTKSNRKHHNNSKSSLLLPTQETTQNRLSVAASHHHSGRRSAPILFTKRSFGPPAFRTSTENVSIQDATIQSSSKTTMSRSSTKMNHKRPIRVDTNYYSPGITKHANSVANDRLTGEKSKHTREKSWSSTIVTAKTPPNSLKYNHEPSSALDCGDAPSCRHGYFQEHQTTLCLSSQRTTTPILRYFTPDLNSGRTRCLFLGNNDDNDNNCGTTTVSNGSTNESSCSHRNVNRNQNNMTPNVLKQLDQLYIEAKSIKRKGDNDKKWNNAHNNNDDDDDDDSNEKTPLLHNSKLSSSSFSSSPSSIKNSVPTKTAVYKKRWYLLFIFSFYNLIWNAVWSTWGPIAQSAKAAFDWTDGTIAMFTWLSNVPIIIIMFPFAYLMDVKGMRISMIVCTSVTMLGTGLRCFSTEPGAATWLNYGGQLLNGVAGTVPMSAGAVISGLWFPANQRATATGIATIMGYLGASVSFIIGPLVVPEPNEADHPINTSQDYAQLQELFGNASSSSSSNITDLGELKDNIMSILYYQCAGAVLIFLLVLVYFPSKPPVPPSKSAASPREDYVDGLKMLIRNKQFWFTAIAYGVPIGVYEVWQVILDVILNPRVSQETAGWLDFYGTVGGCVAGLLVSRFADLFTRQIKLFLIVFYLMASGSILWFILLVNDVLPFDTVSLYTSIIIIGVCLDGSAPLFFELVIEVSYPSGEGVTSGLLQMMVAAAGTVFLSLIQVDSLGKAWMNWCFLGCSVLSVPLLLLIKTEFTRADMDAEDDDTEESISYHDEDTALSQNG